MHKIAVFVGSLRRESINRKFANVLAKLGQSQFEFQFVELGDVPMYNEDLWANPPAAVLKMKQTIAAAQGVLFVTPEYNRALPAVIKNAVDWGTRPWGQNSWTGKPVAIVGTSPGAIGTAVAQADLRKQMVAVDAVVMGHPEVYFVFKPELFDEQHNVVNADTKKFLEGFLNKFEGWISQQGNKR